MKVLIPFIILMLSSFGIAQGSTAELIDEFEKFNCEVFLAHMDYLYLHLNNDPQTTIYLVVSGDKSTIRKKLAVELLRESALVARKYDGTRLKVVRSEESGPLKVRAWSVPDGSQKTDFGESPWDLTFEKSDEPFMLDSEMSEICPSAPFDSVAKELLEANPSGLIYVIVHGKNPAQRRRQLNRTSKRLPGIDKRRVRYFLRKSRGEYSDYYFAVGRHDRTEFKSYF
jgi:hypothetical protein